MKIIGSAVRAGNIIEYDKKIWRVVKHNVVSPGKGSAFNQIEMRDARTGTKTNIKLRADDPNLDALIEIHAAGSRDPLVIQKFIPAVSKGDKRIILIDGKPVGAIDRVPAAGEARSNMHVGGKAVKASLTRRDIELCETIGPELARLGLIFVGIDVIGDYLTEINVTSPTGLQQINRFDGVSLEAQIWDRIEVRYQETRGRK